MPDMHITFAGGLFCSQPQLASCLMCALKQSCSIALDHGGLIKAQAAA